MTIVALTGNRPVRWPEQRRVTIDLGPLKEACSLGLAPSTSTTAMLAMGDALALVASRLREFRREDFARFHPGRQPGSATEQGRRLDARVGRMPLAGYPPKRVREVFVDQPSPIAGPAQSC